MLTPVLFSAQYQPIITSLIVGYCWQELGLSTLQYLCMWGPILHKCPYVGICLLEFSGFFSASFLKHAARRIIRTKKWGNHLKSENLRDIGPFHQHYAWTDPISWDSSFEHDNFEKKKKEEESIQKRKKFNPNLKKFEYSCTNSYKFHWQWSIFVAVVIYLYF